MCHKGMACRTLWLLPDPSIVAVSADPGEEELDNPTPWMNSNAVMVLQLDEDFDSDQRRVLRPVPRVSHYGECLGHEREKLPRPS